MTSKVFGLAAVVIGALGLTSAAHAAPFSPAQLGTVGTGPAVEQVAYGCGPGFIPNRFGYCRPMYRPYGYHGPRRFYGPRYGYYGSGPFLRGPGFRLSLY